MSKIKLNVLGLSYSQTQTGAYALVLSEENGERRIPIIIGGFEAQAIAIELEGLKPPRPLTHDLFKDFAKSFEIEVTEVNIYKLEEGVFFSELICKNHNKTLNIDARTSDAIAIAIRFKCPIFTTSDIIAKAGIVLDMDRQLLTEQEPSLNKSSNETSGDSFKKMNLEQLSEMLNNAIKEEDYEKASKIRDEINKQKKTK